MLARLRDWHQNISWKLGYGRGKKGLPFTCPWWVDKKVYARAYMEGKGLKILSAQFNGGGSLVIRRPASR
jgi:hypothetical protein